MSVIPRLSSQVGDRTEASNHAVAAACLADTALLDEIVGGITSDDAALVGDCVEVLTFVSESRPDLVAPQTSRLIGLLDHPTTRVRWEAVHALSHVATSAPTLVASSVPRLTALLETDRSVIVRDHAVDALVAVACGVPDKVDVVVRTLLNALDRWDGKQAARILTGLAAIARISPGLRDELGGVGMAWSDHPRPGVRKAARALVRAADGPR